MYVCAIRSPPKHALPTRPRLPPLFSNDTITPSTIAGKQNNRRIAAILLDDTFFYDQLTHKVSIRCLYLFAFWSIYAFERVCSS